MNTRLYRIAFTFREGDSIFSELTSPMSRKYAYKTYRQFLSNKKNLQSMILRENNLESGRIRTIKSIDRSDIEKFRESIVWAEDLAVELEKI